MDNNNIVELNPVSPPRPFSLMDASTRDGSMRADDDTLNAAEKRGDVDTDLLIQLKGSISLTWLDKATLTGQDRYVWAANMPLPFFKCKAIYQAAASMPRESVLHLVLADYNMNDFEKLLFDVVYNYGSAKGLQEVCDKVFEFAKEGNMQAAKLLLEYKKEIASESDNANSLSFVLNM